MGVAYARAGSNGGCEPSRSSYRRLGVIARRSAILLSGTAAIALTLVKPASAIVINDQVAAAAGGIANYYDAGNQFPNVVSLFSTGVPGVTTPGSQCTGSLINSRTILTAAHCFLPNDFGIPSISFTPIAGPGAGITSFVRHPDFVPGAIPSNQNDIAVISLAQPVNVTSVAPVKLLMLQPGQPGFPTVGTTITMVGYGLQGTGSSQPAGVWLPEDNPNPPPEGLQTMADSRRRVAMSSLGLYGVPFYFAGVTQPFFVSQFRNPLSPNDPNVFNLPNQPLPLEGATAGGDSGGPLFAVIGGQLVQIGVVRGGRDAILFYCAGPEGPDAPPVVCPDQQNPDPAELTGFVAGNVYGEFSDWTPINLFLQWIQQNGPLREVTAAAGNFNWSNPAAWIDAFPDPARPNGAVPDNTRGSVDFAANQAARYYDVTLSNPGTITLDMNPQIDNLSIMGPQSQLVIDGPYTLQVLLDTRLSAGALTVLPGGILATGAYTQTGGLLQFQLAPSGSGRIEVVNTATLGGTLGVAVTPGLYGLSTPYTLLSAGTISGQFAQFISTPPSAFLSLSGPVYSPTSVDVTLTRTPFGAVAGLNANQRAVGNALEGAYATTLTGAAATLYTNLLMTGTPNALSQLSGEGITAAQNAAFGSGRMFDSLLMDQGAFWRNGETADSSGVTYRTTPLAYAAEKKKRVPSAFKALKEKPPAYEPRGWRVWTAGFGGVQSFSGDAVVGSADARTSAAGGAMGFDYQVDPTRLVGVAVGGSESHFSVPDRATSGDLLGGHVGAYGVATWGALYAAGVLSYSRFDNEIKRTIAGVGPSETATGRFATDLLGARLELGRSYALQWLNVTPFAAVQSSTLWQRGFSEMTTAGGLPGILGLTHGSQTTTSLPTFLGVQLDTRLALANGTVWSPFLRAAWVHEFNPDRSIAGSFVSVPGTLFTVDGARAWSDALKVNAGSRLAINQYASLFASFDGEFANSGHSYAGRGGIRFSW
jgi:outer membrane autotransporter protein